MSDTITQKYELGFHGKGNEYFGIIITNWFFTVITLGIYYPWARANSRKYIYSQTSLNNDRFTFNGTGKEMFIGMLKLFGILIAIYALFALFHFVFHMPALGGLVLYLTMFLIMPLAIHGSFRYRMSRSTWRGIRFGYRGNRKELIINFIKWFFLTIITIGIYGSWMAINLKKYVFGHIRFGNVECKYSGNGKEFFFINLKGYIFTVLTLGIYLFWWEKNLFNYDYGKISFHENEKTLQFNATATAGGLFKLFVGNFFLIFFTLGFGFAWAQMRTMRFLVNNIKIDGNIDLNAIQQTEESYTDASGDDAADFFDIDLF
jgi:uncharacterized membrane protein YjgN (DUF898 family)